MKSLVIAVGCILFASPALAQSVGEKSGINSVLGTAPTTADFVKEAAMSDMFELESNKLAEQKGNGKEKSFARQMVADHTKTSSDLKDLISSGKISAELPAALDSSHQSKLDKLKSASGRDFSSDFNSDQVSAHKDAVSLFERYAKDGDNAELKDWAGKTLPTLRHHLEMAQELGTAPSVGEHRKPAMAKARLAKGAKAQTTVTKQHRHVQRHARNAHAAAPSGGMFGRPAGPGAVAGNVARGAAATATAVATAPFRAFDGGYNNYDRSYDNYYGYGYGGRDWKTYASRNKLVCTPGTTFKGPDGRQQLCQ